MALACDRHQASIVFNYIAAFFDMIPALKKLVIDRRQASIELTNGVTVEVHTNSFRSVRGRTLLCAIFDECAFWSDENSRHLILKHIMQLCQAWLVCPARN